MNRNNYSSRSSAAYDFDMFLPAEKREARIVELPQKNKKPGEREQTGAQSRPVSEGQQAGALRQRLGAISASAIILFMPCAMLYTRSELADMKDQIYKGRKQLDALRNEEVRLNMEIEEKISFANLEQEAQKLGMHKKDLSKIIYIQFEESDRVIVKEPTQNDYLANK